MARRSKKRAPKKPVRIVILDFSEANFEAWAQFRLDREAERQYVAE